MNAEITTNTANTRFNFDADTIEEAREYIKCRAKQLLKHYYKLKSIEEFEWGVSAVFTFGSYTYQSIYILKSYRGKGIYKQNIKDVILTSSECMIDGFLKSNAIPNRTITLTPSIEYLIIENFYGNKKAKRSGVYFMNHIDEGLYILDRINASEVAQKAFCLHPIIQSDENLPFYEDFFVSVDCTTAVVAIEYRSVANEYLSHRKINSIDEIRLSPLKDVNDMLIADKIQNRKDFELYHKGKHERSDELEQYFKNWFERLEISEVFYQSCVEFCKD